MSGWGCPWPAFLIWLLLQMLRVVREEGVKGAPGEGPTWKGWAIQKGTIGSPLSSPPSCHQRTPCRDKALSGPETRSIDTQRYVLLQPCRYQQTEAQAVARQQGTS